MTTHRVIAEPDDGDGWLAMDDAGRVRRYPSAPALRRAVERRDRREAGRRGIVVTMIEWRDVPEGFVPPDAAR